MTDAPKPKPPPPADASRLAVILDGAPLDVEAARALWTEFSVHMDENKGDMAGFAKKKGWQSVVPEYQRGKAVLVVKTGAAPQKAAPQKASPQKAAPQKAAPQKAAPGKGKRSAAKKRAR